MIELYMNQIICFSIYFFRILLFILMLQLIYYTNIKFRTYQDIFVAQERHRLKRKTNESENIENKKMEQKKTKLAGLSTSSQTPGPSETGDKFETFKEKPNFNSSAEKTEGLS